MSPHTTGDILQFIGRMRKRNHIDPFQYTDYRKLLSDYYAEQKKARGGFSFRLFARKVGVRMPNHLKLVMEGQRNLTDDMASRYAKAMGFIGEHAEYFLELVAFNQAKNSEQREECYRRLTAFKGYRKAQKLDVAHSEYYSNWWLPAIREMVLQSNFREDSEWIAKNLVPSISADEAQRAIETLLQMGLVGRDEAGQLFQQEPVVTTGAETRGVHIVSFHRAMMKKASASMDAVAALERDISSLTFCAGHDGLAKIKKRIQEFRKELIAMACEEKKGSQVIQLNMQLFPLTKAATDDEERI